MELSLRMEQVVAMAETCSAAADIGCDHGYVSIELIRRKIAGTVIAMDVRQGPLSRAQEHIEREHLTGQIQCRLSDGLEKLQPGEVQEIVIAGMGGPLMIRILENGRESLDRVQTLVLQPQSEIPEVRRYLHKSGWKITQETMIKEEGKYYTVIQVKPGKETYERPLEYQYGACLLRDRCGIFEEYLKQEEKQYETICRRLERENTRKAVERLEEVRLLLEQNREAQR